jgi:transposase
MNTKTQTETETNIGIDASKKHLDFFIRPSSVAFQVSNTSEGIASAIRKCKSVKPTRIVIEATGRLESAFVAAAHKANLPIVAANPMHVRRFAQATGRQAKTDHLDAQDIAYFGEALKPEPTQEKTRRSQLISDLLIRRSQIIEMRTMEKNRLSILPKPLQASLKRHIK